MKKLILSAWVLIIFGCSVAVVKKSPPSGMVGFWGKDVASRGVASESTFLDPKVAADYFVTDSYHKSVEHKMQLKVTTNMDNAFLKERAQTALHTAFARTLGIVEAEESEAAKKIEKATSEAGESAEVEGEGKTPLFKIFKEELVKELTENFIKTLAIFKIYDGTFQIDLSFVPEKNLAATFDNEFFSNQLIRESEKGKFFEKMKMPRKSILEKVYENPPTDRELPIQYAGGNITVWLNLLDGRLVMSPGKMAARGFIRFRRYYKINGPAFNIKHESEEMAVSSSSLVAAVKNGKHYMTVDVYNTFDSKNMSPTPDKMEVTFGELLDNEFFADSFFKKIITSSLASLKTSELVLAGKIKKGLHRPEFKLALSKAVYSFSEHKISELTLSALTDNGNKSWLGGGSESKVKNALLASFNKELVEELFLSRFYSLGN